MRRRGGVITWQDQLRCSYGAATVQTASQSSSPSPSRHPPPLPHPPAPARCLPAWQGRRGRAAAPGRHRACPARPGFACGQQVETQDADGVRTRNHGEQHEGGARGSSVPAECCYSTLLHWQPVVPRPTSNLTAATLGTHRSPSCSSKSVQGHGEGCCCAEVFERAAPLHLQRLLPSMAPHQTKGCLAFVVINTSSRRSPLSATALQAGHRKNQQCLCHADATAAVPCCSVTAARPPKHARWAPRSASPASPPHVALVAIQLRCVNVSVAQPQRGRHRCQALATRGGAVDPQPRAGQQRACTRDQRQER